MTHILLWNFHGPDARPTAQHFRKHLRDFVARNTLRAETSLLSDGPLHTGVVCRCDAPTAQSLEQALRPQGRCPADAFAEAYPNIGWDNDDA